MAFYGLNSGTGRVVFTGWSNTIGPYNGAANIGSAIGTIDRNGIDQQDDKHAKLWRSGGMQARTRAIMRRLLGNGVGGGGNVVVTKKQVGGTTLDANGNIVFLNPSGVVGLDTITLINRPTNTGDLIAFQLFMDRVGFPSTYVKDVSGNGGGDKQVGGPW